ncbi:MAG TPA: FtsX-like permease family protein [Acidobacteriota bacterium]|nr:FtsX-like permease family protein [Acidobacteriota bacterium]
MVILCLVAILLPFITAMAISEGVKFQASISVDEGADIYVTRDNYGSNAPISIKFVEQFNKLEGVIKVVPRVVGRTYFTSRLVVITGIVPENIPPNLTIIEGRAFQKQGEVIIGKALSEEFNLGIGTRFSLTQNPYVTFRIAGIFQADLTIWSADMILMSYEDASSFFVMKGMATDILIYTRPGYATKLAEKIQEEWAVHEKSAEPPLRVQDKSLVKRYFLRGYNYRAGVFTALYMVAFALAIPAILVTSGFGLTERRREIGVLKATGWQTQDVLEMVALENLVISLTGAPLAILLSIVWLKIFNGAFIAQFFIAELGLFSRFSVPCRFLPLPALLGFIFAIILTMVGALYSTWKTSVIPPAEATR